MLNDYVFSIIYSQMNFIKTSISNTWLAALLMEITVVLQIFVLFLSFFSKSYSRTKKSIVEILSECDKVIRVEKELFETENKKFKQVIQSLFINCSSDVVPIIDLIDFKKGQVVKLSEDNCGVPYIGSASFNGMFKNYTSAIDGVPCINTDVLLLWDGENAGKSTTGLSGVVGSTVGRLRPKKNINHEFLNGILQLNFSRIQTMREGSGIPHMPTDFLQRFKVPNVPIVFQEKIARFLVNERQKKFLQNERIKNLQKLKQGLMQKLLTGKIHVKGIA